VEEIYRVCMAQKFSSLEVGQKLKVVFFDPLDNFLCWIVALFVAHHRKAAEVFVVVAVVAVEGVEKIVFVELLAVDDFAAAVVDCSSEEGPLTLTEVVRVETA
jgi:hypothetical protein